MTPTHAIPMRSFSNADQLAFARLSGDCNPVHLDATFARRTMFGRPIVHGMHIALWMLDWYAGSATAPLRFRKIAARFNRPLFLDESTAILSRDSSSGVDLQCVVDGTLLTQLKLTEPAVATRSAWTPSEVSWSSAPAELDLGAMAGYRGELALPYKESDIARLFPSAIQVYGPAALAHILALTRVVGMEIPGLHSLFGGFSVELSEGGSSVLNFATTRCNTKTSHVKLQFSSDVLNGSVDAFLRPQSTALEYPQIARDVRRGEFADRRSLVIGGSRGLGRVSAMLLGAGGADVAITYRVGRDEAGAVVNTIRHAGGKADAVALDVANPADGFAALSKRGFQPTDVYYFATPHIFERKKELFEPGIFDRFAKCYVTDFANIVDSSLALSGGNLSVFYPSSDALNNPVKELMEYTAAKAAGEAYCAMLAKFTPRVRVLQARLPRLPTDQTATLMTLAAADPSAAMLDVCRKMAAPGVEGSGAGYAGQS